MADTTASILTRGFTPRNLSAFEVMLQRPGKGKYALATTNAPDVGVVDIDGSDGLKTWAQFRRDFPKLPAIVMSVRDPSIEGAAFVQKPVRVDELLKTLRLALEHGTENLNVAPRKQQASLPAVEPAEKADAAPELKSKPAQSATSAETDDGHLKIPKPAFADNANAAASVVKRGEPEGAPAAEPEMFDNKRPAYAASLTMSDEFIERVTGSDEDTDLNDLATLRQRVWRRANTLLDLVEKAWSTASKYRVPIEVSGGFTSMYLLPNGHVLLSVSDNALRSYCVVHLDTSDISMRRIGLGDIREMMKADPAVYRWDLIESFFWKLALWTARGKLPERVNVEQPVSISRWPNLTRDLASPYAMPIASLLYQYPTTIPGLCRELGIPQRYVFAFVSAAHAIGILDQSDQAEPAPEARPEANSAKKSLFQRILGRIGY